MASKDLRQLTVLAVVVIGLALGAACSSASAPSSSTAPASPSAKPAQSTAKPTESKAPASSPAAEAAWKVEWDKTVAAAKKEGKVVVDGSTGDTYRTAFTAFQKAYPEIVMDYSGQKGGDYIPRITAERSAGQFLWDVHIGGTTSALTQMRPAGMLDPIKPALVLPEVLDSSKWLGGFENAWMDKDKQYIFGFEAGLFYFVWVNRSMVPESELSTIDQILDPKWKGKIVAGDPRGSGAGNGAAAALLVMKGEPWLRKLYAQDLVIMKDERPIVESVVRGRYPILLGVNTASIEQFRLEGVADHVKPLEPDTANAASLSSGSGNVMLVNRAPHPNAARVFVNWLLSKEGQTAYVQATNQNVRRADATAPGFYTPKANLKYGESTREDMIPAKEKVQDIAKEFIK